MMADEPCKDLPRSKTLEDIERLIWSKIFAGMYHKRRGFRLSDAQDTDASVHLIEEAVELHAEVLNVAIRPESNPNAALARIESEAADVLGCLLHVMRLRKISLATLLDLTYKQIDECFVPVDQITAAKPGFTRHGRAADFRDNADRRVNDPSERGE